MDTSLWRFWRTFRVEAARQSAELYPHKPDQPWNDNRHVGERPRTFAAYVYHIFVHKADVSLEIYTRPDDFAECNRIFHCLQDQQSSIEARFGQRLVWEERPDSHISFIRFPMEGIGFLEEEQWTELQPQMLASMERLMQALDPALRTITSPYA